MTGLAQVYSRAADWLEEDPSRWRGGYDCGSVSWERVDQGSCVPVRLKRPSRARSKVCGACIQGAVALFCPDRWALEVALSFLDDELLGESSYEWNDEEGRTVDEVIGLLRRASKEVDD